MKRSHTIVRAFDGTRREVAENIEIPLQIGPCTYTVNFQVMDIKPSYSCLIGRPWIHSAGAVPSSLHQKLKFVIDGKLVSIAGEEEIIAMTSIEAPYVEPNEEALDCSFRSLEFVNAAFVKEGSKILMPQLSKSSLLGVNEILGREAQIGKGLGKHLQGKVKIVPITMKMDRYGLGYQPSKEDRWKQIEQRKGRRLARLGQFEVEKPMSFPPLYETFRLAGFIYPDPTPTVPISIMSFSKGAIHMVGEKELDEIAASLAIHPCLPGYVLNNWSTVNLSLVSKPSM